MGFKYCSRMKYPKLKPLSSAETDLNSYLLCLPQLLFFSAGGEKQTELRNCAMYRIALFFSLGWLFLLLFPLPGYVLPAARLPRFSQKLLKIWNHLHFLFKLCTVTDGSAYYKCCASLAVGSGSEQKPSSQTLLKKVNSMCIQRCFGIVK